MGRSTLQTHPLTNRERDTRGIRTPNGTFQTSNQLQISKQTVGVATDMALAHGLIIRNLNAIYLQAEGVSKAEDIKDFILFAQVVMDEIHLHHAFEEQYFFPWIGEYTGEKDIMETNIAQHHAFEKGIKKFREYIDNVTPEIYDGKEMKRFLNEFGPILSQHLTDEIATLLGLDKYGGDKLKATSDRLEAKVIASLTEKVCICNAVLQTIKG
jgi:hypothetical protein